MKILLLEDDVALRTHVERAMMAAGHVVDTSSTGPDALFLATSNAYDVLVLDRMVPGLDGLSIMKALRVAQDRTPVLLLTAMDGIEDRVEGLEAGADDYLVKPFAVTELIARINALMRRPPISETTTVLRVGDLEMHLIRRSVTRAGRKVELQAQEFKLLEYLVRHAGELVTRTMLLENVWSFHFDPQSNIIESHMSRLRAKVDRGFERELIQTVRGAGYRIDAG
ncbi:response regulator transcription factor [Novosphingobium sp. 9]|uniref:winged helix-turn-helix domain-containing protein n=1 Tax=Novosphingobium sp. 9 TaxID=2025349 RepID=UPI0021B60169|nr:response regulator transcription factor [Novosphingobium sp. 9]